MDEIVIVFKKSISLQYISYGHEDLYNFMLLPMKTIRRTVIENVSFLSVGIRSNDTLMSE